MMSEMPSGFSIDICELMHLILMLFRFRQPERFHAGFAVPGFSYA